MATAAAEALQVSEMEAAEAMRLHGCSLLGHAKFQGEGKRNRKYGSAYFRLRSSTFTCLSASLPTLRLRFLLVYSLPASRPNSVAMRACTVGSGTPLVWFFLVHVDSFDRHGRTGAAVLCGL